MPLLQVDLNGLWCEQGGFYIDPWRPVARALATHGHSDHVRRGSESYLCAAPSEPLLRARLGSEIFLETLNYGERRTIGNVSVSFHPAGHILGSAQIRVEHRGEVWVVSGDYKLAPDVTCAPFEPVQCHTFVTESTFGLPIYRWPAQSVVGRAIGEWWRTNQRRGKASVLFAYPLGKSQRVLAQLEPENGPIFCHGAIERINQIYRSSGVTLPQTLYPGSAERGYNWSKSLILAPPSAHGSPWMKRFGAISTGFVSGWMRIRGTRRRRSIDRGFVLSDHADWPGLQQAIDESGAECVLVTHGYRGPLVRWLEEQGKQARALETLFDGEGDEAVSTSLGEEEMMDGGEGEPGAGE
jgi:putative mRNA 3-end processing factor